MENSIILLIIFYLLLIDSIGANIVSWFGLRKWYQGNFSVIAKYLPLTKVWTTYYFLLILFIGFLIHNFVRPLF